MSNEFGKYLEEFLKKNNYKIEVFAKEVGYSTGLISHYTTGKRSPSYKFIDSFFKKFHFSSTEKEKVLKMLEKDKMPDSLKKLKTLEKETEISQDTLERIKQLEEENKKLKEKYAQIDERVLGLDKRSFNQYEKTMNEASLFFQDENVSDEDKQKLMMAINEMFFRSKEINKKKYAHKNKNEK